MLGIHSYQEKVCVHSCGKELHAFTLPLLLQPAIVFHVMILVWEIPTLEEVERRERRRRQRNIIVQNKTYSC